MMVGSGGEEERPQRRLQEGNGEEAPPPSWLKEQPRVSLGPGNPLPSRSLACNEEEPLP
jgi:hypothetical protein